jgi:dephospho-CoA kinase
MPRQTRHKPLIIGLTGGIASGKSAVAEGFVQLGAPLLDADQVARELTAPGAPLLERIRARFGAAYFHSDNSLNRSALRRLMLDDDSARADLENLLHPPIYRILWQRAREISAPYCLVSVPLLIETGHADQVDRLLVVDCPPALQRRRLAERDRAAPADIEKLLRIQCARQTRLALADEVIYNSHDLAALMRQVCALDVFYQVLSKQERR